MPVVKTFYLSWMMFDISVHCYPCLATNTVLSISKNSLSLFLYVSGINSLSLRQPHSGTNFSIPGSPIPASTTYSAFDSPSLLTITPSLFLFRLKTYLFTQILSP